MDEEMGNLKFGELNLLGMEDACKRNAFHAISPKQIYIIKECLYKEGDFNKQGVQRNPPKDKKKVI